jgi:hypothetical protein
MSLEELARGYTDILKEIENGEKVEVIGPTWDEVYAGDVTFECKGWRFVLFNDCGELYYTDNVRAPDGSKATFDELFDGQCDPICYEPLADELNLDQLQAELSQAKRGAR